MVLGVTTSNDPDTIILFTAIALALFLAQLSAAQVGRSVRWPLWATSTQAGRVAVLVLYGVFVTIGIIGIITTA